MSLWVDKHRPTSLDKLHYHLDVSDQLKQLATSGDFPHLMFYGPSCAGKKTRIMCFLREIFGPAAEKLKIEHKEFTHGSRRVEISTLASNYHIEVNPSDAGIHDYTVVRMLLKEVAQSQQLDTTVRAFKVVVINEADKLTKDAQHALRRIMEKYMGNCRYILCCNNTSKLIGAIRSRCLGIRVAAPTQTEIVTILQATARKEGMRVPDELATRVAQDSHRNLRRAILMLEACRVQASGFAADQPVQRCDWEVYVAETARLVLQAQTPARLMEVRGRLYELLTHCIPASVVLKTLTLALIATLDTTLKVDVVRFAAEFEHRMQLGSKSIYHLEAFVAKFMSVYRNYLSEFN